MVRRVGPRGAIPYNPGRQDRSNDDLKEEIRGYSLSAESHLASGNTKEAAVAFSTAARRSMELAGRFQWDGAIEWLERSIGPRQKAIKYYGCVGRGLDEARDISFLGKAYSRLGILEQDQRALMRSVIERSLALELFKDLGRMDLAAEEHSYLADDFRALGRFSKDREMKHHFFLTAHRHSEEAVKIYPGYLRGPELISRIRHETQFSAQALAGAAFVFVDQTHLSNIQAARDKNLHIAEELKRSGFSAEALHALSLAAKLQRSLCREILTNIQEINYALDLTLRLRKWLVEEGKDETGLSRLDEKIIELQKLLGSLTVPASA